MTHTPNGEREAAKWTDDEIGRAMVIWHRILKGGGLPSDAWRAVMDCARAIALLQSPAAVQQGEADVSTLPDLYWHITRNALRDGSPFAVACMGALPALNAAVATPSPASPEVGGLVDAMRQVCAEAYQVVGSLLSDLGAFETPKAEKILDNLSQMRMVHDDVLPWPSFAALAPSRQAGGEAVEYFAVDASEGSFDTFATLAEAKAKAQEFLDYQAEDALESGWKDQPPQVHYGIVLGGCTEVAGSRGDPTPNFSGGTVDYELTDTHPAPSAESAFVRVPREVVQQARGYVQPTLGIIPTMRRAEVAAALELAAAPTATDEGEA